MKKKKLLLLLILWVFPGGESLSGKTPHSSEPWESPEYLRLSLEKPGRDGRPARFESEHRAKPKRVYWLQQGDYRVKPEAFQMLPEGEEKKLDVEISEDGWSVTVPLATRGKKRDRVHGANNIYVTEKKVREDLLFLRTAKWITIQHTCRWGHDEKHNKIRQTPLFSEKVPLEIVPRKLWDGNFHVKTGTGDIFRAKVCRYGKPVPGAAVTVVSGTGWTKKLRTDEKGEISFQIIRDYYPKSWERFKRSKKSRLLILAEYTDSQNGEYSGKPFKGRKYTSTLSWRYSPAKEDYTSYSSGLLMGTLFLLLSAGGIFYYRERRKVPEKDIFITDRRRFEK